MKRNIKTIPILPNVKGARELKEAHKALSKMPISKELVDFLMELKASEKENHGSTPGGESSGTPLAAKGSKE